MKPFVALVILALLVGVVATSVSGRKQLGEQRQARGSAWLLGVGFVALLVATLLYLAS